MRGQRRAGDAEDASPAGVRKDLSSLDFTLLVVGAIIGADVYVVAGFGSAYLGPAQLVAWLAAGVLAALIALAFVQCAAIYPRVGGSYAYARAAFGPLAGFVAGWALYVGEWVALPVFPLAFVNYLGYLLPDLSPVEILAVKVLLVGGVTWVNVQGVRSGGRLNDVLTVAKLVPLTVLLLAGLALVAFRPALALDHLTPFAPLGWKGFGPAILLIFWAYAGFELAALPAGEVRDPRRALPRGLVVGVAIATLFYLLTAFAVVVALPWRVSAASSRPLADALGAIFAAFAVPAALGGVLMSVGALVSIVGVFDVFTLCVARLSYAMAADGLFPAAFRHLHPRSRTPLVGILFQGASALVFSVFFDLGSLISIAVFFLGICYVLTALAALRLVAQAPDRRLHVPAVRVLLALAALSGAYLSAQAPWPLIALGLIVLVAGVAVYGLRQGAWRRAADLARTIESEEAHVERWARQREAWLLHAVRRPFARRPEDSRDRS